MGKKLDLTPEQKKERSDRAKQLVAEGKIGGPQPGSGRPRKKRASEIVAEKARDRAADIVAAFEELVEGGPPAVRLQAAQAWLQIEQKEAELQLKEERFGEDMSDEDLKQLIVRRLAKIQAEKDIEKLEGSIDAEVVSEETVPELSFNEENEHVKSYEGGSPWG